MAKRVKRNVRFDSRHVRLKTGETEKSNGGYEYRWTSADGKRHSIYAPTLEQLREMEEQIIVDKHDGIKADVKALTVNDCFKLWKELKRGVKDSTFQNYVYMYEMFVMPTFGKKRVVQVQRSDIKRFYNGLVDQKVLKISTVDNIHNVLHQVFQVAVDDNYIRQNPTDRMLKELRVAHGHEIEKRKALTLEQQELFFNYMKNTPQYRHWYPVFYIMANTGMRVGELTGLRWQDVDMENGIISVNHTLVYYNHRDELGTYFSINTPKTEAGCREIPMVAGVKEAFEMIREYQQEAGIQSKARIDGYEDFIFVNKDGNMQHHGTLNKAIKRICRDCNDQVLLEQGIESNPVLLPNFSCHILRHTFATRLCESGINIKVIQDVLGHVNVSTTMDIYVDVMNETKKRELANFDGYMANARA
ncbi:MAG: tyrosine-type recombinase/integrase [Oscillospiraceae bacterium]|nr:tyrosine-type recombinase/integrase [Oscillospiraceae bacterium]